VSSYRRGNKIAPLVNVDIFIALPCSKNQWHDNLRFLSRHSSVSELAALTSRIILELQWMLYLSQRSIYLSKLLDCWRFPMVVPSAALATWICADGHKYFVFKSYSWLAATVQSINSHLRYRILSSAVRVLSPQWQQHRFSLYQIKAQDNLDVWAVSPPSAHVTDNSDALLAVLINMYLKLVLPSVFKSLVAHCIDKLCRNTKVRVTIGS
jgi:hypothetical protein